jgi:hypothetical protein
MVTEIEKVKEYLKTQYNYSGFIEHTLVSEMCVNYNKMMFKKFSKDINERIKYNLSFLNTEDLSNREKNIIKQELRFLKELYK